jgi:hypothetical protein
LHPGVCTSAEYNATPKADRCKKKDCAFKISGYQTVNTCDALKSQLMKQPIAVTVDATNWAPYKAGIFSNCKSSLNHIVLLTAMADEYWRCRNSWGTSWGEKGDIRLAPGSTCGICNLASYPIY